MNRSRLVIVLGFVGLFAPCVAVAQEDNYPSRKPIIVNTCPFVELSGFSFQNRYAGWTDPLRNSHVLEEHRQATVDRIRDRHSEVRRLRSASHWRTLDRDRGKQRRLESVAARSQSADGTIGFRGGGITAIGYVRAARLADNTIWTVNDAQLLTEAGEKIFRGSRILGTSNQIQRPSHNDYEFRGSYFPPVRLAERAEYLKWIAAHPSEFVGAFRWDSHHRIHRQTARMSKIRRAINTKRKP